MCPATVPSPWLLVMWLCTLLVTGSACGRRFQPPVSREDFWSCCRGVEDCFAVLQDAEAPELDPSISWDRVAPEVVCASHWLRAADERDAVFARLVALLSEPSPRVRDAAAYVLSEMRGGAHDAVPALLELHEKHPRGEALAALVRIDDPRAVPLLRQSFQLETQPLLPCLRDTLAPVLLEELENPGSPVWARPYGLPSICNGSRPEQRSRLRELLRRELAEPSLRRPSGASCQEPAPQTCQVVLDGCLPHAASLIRLLAPVSRDEEEAEVLEALAPVACGNSTKRVEGSQRPSLVVDYE